jgi:hypothetical protein
LLSTESGALLRVTDGTRPARPNTKVGKSIIENQVQIVLSADALLLLIDDKLASLRTRRLNSDEAQQEIAQHEELKRNLVDFRQATLKFLAGTLEEDSAIEAANSFSDTIKVSSKFLDMGLFILGATICTMIGSDATIATIVSGALVGGGSVTAALKAWASR